MYIIRTVSYDRDTGAQTGGINQIDLRGNEIVVLRMFVDNAESISDVEFEIIPGSFDISDALRYESGRSFEKKTSLARSFSEQNLSISVGTIESNSTEYLYIQLNPSLLTNTSGSFSFKWKFNYVEGTQSLSSSSSNEYGVCRDANVATSVPLNFIENVPECFNVILESTQYMTLSFTVYTFEVYNSGGSLQIDGEDILPGGLYTNLGLNTIEFLLNYTNYNEKFVLMVTNLGTIADNNIEFSMLPTT